MKIACVDDFGELVINCSYTEALVWARNAVAYRMYRPAKRKYRAPTPEALAGYKYEVACFNEVDANCNTCKWLSREKHPKHKGGELEGWCDNPNSRLDRLHYKPEGAKIMFHPEDCMGMPCWEAR